MEHLIISKDTSESDLKQRKEIINGSVVYIDQAPVRAAVHGRLLILDGIEKAERNVLPTLNNLLENREMSLEDGRFLMRDVITSGADTKGMKEIAQSRLIEVHPNFRVIALGTPVPPYPGRTLDPPLRSRFQCRFVGELSTETLLSCLNLKDVPLQPLQDVINFYEACNSMKAAAVSGDSTAPLASIPSFSFERVEHCLSLLRMYPSTLSSAEAVSRSFPLGCFLTKNNCNEEMGEKLFPTVVRCAETLLNSSPSSSSSLISQPLDTELNDLTSSQKMLANKILQDLSAGGSICLFGSKGSGKSHIVSRALAAASSFLPSTQVATRVFPLYQEISSRDFLSRRATSKDDVSGQVVTTWEDSPLIAAARDGCVCVLDGIDRVDSHCLLALSRLLGDGNITLPSGEKLLAVEGFRVVAISAVPLKTEDARSRYVLSDLGLSYHYFPAMNAKEIEEVIDLEMGDLKDRPAVTMLKATLRALHEVNVQELKPSLRTSLRAFRLLQTMLNRDDDDEVTPGDVLKVVENTFMIRFQSTQVNSQFNAALNRLGLDVADYDNSSGGDGTNFSGNRCIKIRRSDGILSIGNVSVPVRTPKEIALMPNPLYYENPSQTAVLQEMLRGYSIPDNPLLLIGNQGVGKNKMVDYLLYLLKAEREYVQLHRDTTIQSLTVLPKVEFGEITYEDTPLVRAARVGRVLVLDEADKAPLEVVCLLKGLVGDGEVQLGDGYRLLSQKRLQQEYAVHLNNNEQVDLDAYIAANNVVRIHPDFRLFVLANRPGIPFLGNNFFRECGDLFTTLVIENPDIDSELQLLVASAPNADKYVMTSLAKAFADLRKHHEDGVLSYPFSAREAVAVAKHLQHFPLHGMNEALHNILDFDTLNVTTREFIAEVFRKRGFEVDAGATREVRALLDANGNPVRITGGLSREGGVSKPRTDVGAPKHGKEDDKPHVGGNQWAGGTGGSDTAGLGGRGGPYRLDKGHQIHQVSDEDKSKVSEESKQKAAEMAAKALQKKLEDINMGAGDYATFKKYRELVQSQVSQIKEMLEEVLRRKKERVWLRNQNHGDLDDSKLVDGLTGERLIFKKRGIEGSKTDDPLGDEDEKRKKYIQFVMDVSGSMMRFNSMDGRLERMLQTTLMIMEALPRSSTSTSHTSSNESKFDAASLMEYSISGHSGDTENEVFVDFPAKEGEFVDIDHSGSTDEETQGINRYFSYRRRIEKNIRRGILTEKDKMAILETMIAHSQFCLSGDSTLESIEAAVDRVRKRGGMAGDGHERIVIVVSDANFRRYGISAQDLKEAMGKDSSVVVHLILIASLRDEARDITAKLPAGRVHVCFDNHELPTVMRKILTADSGIDH